jgi:protein required for attachment to host cells
MDCRGPRPRAEETASRGSAAGEIGFLRKPRPRATEIYGGAQAGPDQGTSAFATAFIRWRADAAIARPADGPNRRNPMTDIRLAHDIWVLVADGEKALFLRNEGDAQYPNLQVVRKLREENPPTREQGTDAPGRTGLGGTPTSAMEETDWHRIAKERFADEIAERLYAMAHRGDFDRIVLVAPPAVLGAMRQKLHKEVTERIEAEVPKTLTGHPVDQIEKILKAA